MEKATVMARIDETLANLGPSSRAFRAMMGGKTLYGLEYLQLKFQNPRGKTIQKYFEDDYDDADEEEGDTISGVRAKLLKAVGDIAEKTDALSADSRGTRAELERLLDEIRILAQEPRGLPPLQRR